MRPHERTAGDGSSRRANSDLPDAPRAVRRHDRPRCSSHRHRLTRRRLTERMLMADTANSTPVPDFRNGVRAADLPDGGLLAGRVGDEEAVLARSGDDVFAIG